ncbi:MAG: flagellar protein FlgN [Desulfobulbaceae bacterium]|nr:flagellar protein FlgN [Desulfobulbaceae bacterium]HIJ89733.1 flagellar protein FlgN [Deltaproteobacteria bacterium]
MSHTQTTEHRSLPSRFFEALEQEVHLSEDMLAILSEEQQAMLAMDMQALMLLNGRKENRLGRIQAMDTLLQDMAGQFLSRAAGQSARLSELIPAVPPEEGEKLTLYRQKLAALREDILSRNQTNKLFAADVKKYLNDALSMITSGIADRPMYGATGMSRKASLNQPSFISREV